MIAFASDMQAWATYEAEKESRFLDLRTTSGLTPVQLSRIRRKLSTRSPA